MAAALGAAGALGSSELHPAASPASLPCPPYPRGLIQPRSALLCGKKIPERESSRSKSQTVSQVMPRSAEVPPLPSHALAAEGRSKQVSPSPARASWNRWLALPPGSGSIFSKGLFLRLCPAAPAASSLELPLAGQGHSLGGGKG